MSTIRDALPVLIYSHYNHKLEWHEQTSDRLGLLISFDTIRRMYECYQMAQRWSSTYRYASNPAIDLDDTIIIHSNVGYYLAHYMYWDSYNYTETEINEVASNLQHGLIRRFYDTHNQKELVPPTTAENQMLTKTVVLYRMIGQLDRDELLNMPDYKIHAHIGPSVTTITVYTDDLDNYRLYRNSSRYDDDVDTYGEIHHQSFDIASEDIVSWYKLVVSIETGLAALACGD